LLVDPHYHKDMVYESSDIVLALMIHMMIHYWKLIASLTLLPLMKFLA
jgi:hypothetical protein